MAVLPPDPIFTLRGDMGFIHCLCFLPDKPQTKLLAGTEAGVVHFWNLKTNRVIHKLEVAPSILSVVPTETNLITQEKTGSIKVWQSSNDNDYKKMFEVDAGLGFCRCITFKNFLVASQENSAVEIFDMKNYCSLYKLRPEADKKFGNVMCLKNMSHNSDEYLLVGYESGDLLLWNLSTHKYCSQAKLREFITSLDFDVINGRGVCGNSSDHLQVFTIDRNLNIALKCDLRMTNKGSNIVKIRKDRKVFVSGGWDGFVRIFSWKSLRPLAVLTEHKGTLSDIAFSEELVAGWDKMVMAAAGSDGQITLWDLYN